MPEKPLIIFQFLATLNFWGQLIKIEINTVQQVRFDGRPLNNTIELTIKNFKIEILCSHLVFL